MKKAIESLDLFTAFLLKVCRGESNMNEKRKVEEECMNIAIKQNSILQGYKIDESRTAKGIEEERPDFILTRGDSRIGVEHFLVDTLVKNMRKKVKRYMVHLADNTVNKCKIFMSDIKTVILMETKMQP